MTFFLTLLKLQAKLGLLAEVPVKKGRSSSALMTLKTWSLYTMEFWVPLKIRVSTGTISLGVKNFERHPYVPRHKLHLLYHDTRWSPTPYCSRNLNNCTHVFLCILLNERMTMPHFGRLLTMTHKVIKSSCLKMFHKYQDVMESPWYLRLGNAGVYRRCNQGLSSPW